MISTSTYDHSFAFSQKTANQLLGDSLRSPPVPIDQRNQGTVIRDKPENLEMSVTSEVTYANHAAVINPEIKFMTNKPGKGGLGLHEYLKSINFNSKQWN